MNLALEIALPEEPLNEDDSSSALAACYLLARRRVSILRTQADSDHQEIIEAVAPEQQKDRHSDD